MKISLNKTCLSSSLTSLFLFSTSILLNLNLPPSLSPSPHPSVWEHTDLGWTLGKILILSVLGFESVKQDTTCDTGLL